MEMNGFMRVRSPASHPSAEIITPVFFLVHFHSTSHGLEVSVIKNFLFGTQVSGFGFAVENVAPLSNPRSLTALESRCIGNGQD